MILDSVCGGLAEAEGAGRIECYDDVALFGEDNHVPSGAAVVSTILTMEKGWLTSILRLLRLVDRRGRRTQGDMSHSL